ncbi:type VI secretion system tip protein TssI/VgrG [Paraburkholderia phymatum]|uniref:Type VI secretion system Vgr family protein n=1 Tax=Paraburkholderia phymatum (strain DSM 17167 / CIP 108236 / LMG 21445 / STM815) TaxID=391038 RepID=B2JW54_PARP8|nr:type VI secretion system tip protein TssI/VgrG [Paraburkholderia phymatum]ACC75181.1 type VI secretion system Vgr family protein [Paraburkholderia phymatum STM815]
MLQFLTNRTLTIDGPAIPLSSTGDPVLQLQSIAGTEILSRIYRYVLDCVTVSDLLMTDAASLDLKSMIGKELTVTVQLDGMGSFVPGMTGLSGAANIGKGIREISGIVTEARFVGQSNRQGHYRLLLQPWITLADQQSTYRIFQNKTVVEIVDQVFGSYMFSWDKRLSAEYKELEYQVQYGETDFIFAQRLMQEHGIYWFFEHSNKIHRMVLVDQLGAHKPVDSAAYQTLQYYPPGHKIDMEYIDSFDASESIQSGRWTTSDFNFKKPRARLGTENALPRDTEFNELERYEWPGDYSDTAVGEDFARIRMQELYAPGTRAWGSGNLRDVVCGTTFTLAGYPQQSANCEYLVVSASFAASELGESTGAGEFSVRSSFVVQPATVVFRPPRTVPKPRTTGPQTAIVTGPDGQEIWTDQYGRVKLKFHWDRSPVRNQKSSCWVRVAYPWAGNNFGTINIPRIGQEVIVDFENGDPDRPIVTGRVYNGANMPPWPLPDNATQSGTLSRSEDGNYETANAIRFEDKKGREEVWIHAEKDMRTEVENDEVHAVEHDQTITINHDHTKHVGNDEQVDIGHDRTHRITQDDSLAVGRSLTLTVSKDYTGNVGNNRTEKVAADYQIQTGGNVQHTVQGRHQLQAGQGIARKTQVYELVAGERLVLKAPGGSLTIDSSGITLNGISIHLKGAVTQENGTGGAPTLNGIPVPAQLPDPTHLPLSD